MDEALDWLQLIRTPRIGPVTFRKLLVQYGSARAALAALPDLAAELTLSGEVIAAIYLGEITAW